MVVTLITNCVQGAPLCAHRTLCGILPFPCVNLGWLFGIFKNPHLDAEEKGEEGRHVLPLCCPVR